MLDNRNHLCPYCLITTKQNVKCGKCGRDCLIISSKLRVPKCDASKSKWKELLEASYYLRIIVPEDSPLGKLKKSLK